MCLLSSLARALQPSVLMQMKLSDGSFHRFEVFSYNCSWLTMCFLVPIIFKGCFHSKMIFLFD